VKQTPGGIGYVELTYAKENNLPVAVVRNRAGNWVEPSAASTAAAINAFSEELAKDGRVPIVDPPASAKDAYPIASLISTYSETEQGCEKDSDTEGPRSVYRYAGSR